MPESRLYWACFSRGSGKGRLFEDYGVCKISAEQIGSDTIVKSFGSRLAAQSWLEQMERPSAQTSLEGRRIPANASARPSSHWLSNRSDGQGGGTVVLMPGQRTFSVTGRQQMSCSQSPPTTTASKKRGVNTSARVPASQPERKVAKSFHRSSSGAFIDLIGDDERDSSLHPTTSSSQSTPRLAATPTIQSKKTMAEFNADIERMCSFEQKQVIKYVTEGQNVCFTGSAGTGKSFLIQKLCERLEISGKKRFEDFFVTASTGIAAVPLGGSTVHSFSSIGRGEKGTKLLVHQIKRSAKAMDRWKKAFVLIIDEVSMLSSDIFDKIDQVGRRIRGKPAPFGGLQIILSGDFFQLPPVPDKIKRCPECGGFNKQIVPEDRTKLQCLTLVDIDGKKVVCGETYLASTGYCFESRAWANLNLRVVHLKKIFRQHEMNFVSALNSIRVGTNFPEALALLRSCCRVLPPNQSEVTIYPLRASVDEENNRQFALLHTPTFTTQAYDFHKYIREGEANLIGGEQIKGYHPEYSEYLKDLPAPSTLSLREGAQVMLLTNISVQNGLVNGTRGVISDWMDEKEAFAQINLDPGSKEELARKKEVMSIWKLYNPAPKYPCVKFENGVQQIVIPNVWDMQISRAETVGRIQIPLTIAYALTIHKCQGMTLTRCIIHLSRCFGYGMAYVALSRAKSLDGLQIEGWDASKIKADPSVIKFYQELGFKPVVAIT